MRDRAIRLITTTGVVLAALFAAYLLWFHGQGHVGSDVSVSTATAPSPPLIEPRKDTLARADARSKPAMPRLPPPTAIVGPIRLTVRVIDVDSRDPIGSAALHVRLESAGTWSTFESDGNGSIAADFASAGDGALIQVVGRKNGWAPASLVVSLARKGNANVVTLPMHRGGSLRGRVEVLPSRSPPPGAVSVAFCPMNALDSVATAFRLSTEGSPSVIKVATDRNGDFSSDELDAGVSYLPILLGNGLVQAQFVPVPNPAPDPLVIEVTRVSYASIQVIGDEHDLVPPERSPRVFALGGRGVSLSGVGPRRALPVIPVEIRALLSTASRAQYGEGAVDALRTDYLVPDAGESEAGWLDVVESAPGYEQTRARIELRPFATPLVISPLRMRRMTQEPFGAISVALPLSVGTPSRPSKFLGAGALEVQEVRVTGVPITAAGIAALYGRIRFFGEEPLRFPSLPPGDYELEFLPTTLVGVEFSPPTKIVVRAGEVSDVKLVPPAKSWAAIACHIVDSDGREHLGPVTLALRATHVPQRVRRWEFARWESPPYLAEGLGPRTLELRVISPVVIEDTQTVDLSAGGEITLNFTLKKASVR